MKHNFYSCGRYLIYKATRISRKQMIACCVLAFSTLNSQFSISAQDTVRRLDEVIISSSRADNKTPLTTSTLDRKTLEENKINFSLPYMLDLEPSVVTSSENGTVGVTSMRIRGVDATRINVNINGIPPIFAIFEIFSYAGHITLFISLLLIHRYNKSFFYSFLSLSLFLVLAFIVYLCMGSSRPVDNAIGRGFQWGKNISEGVFYLYYFHGCLLFFEKHGLSKGPKTFKVFIVSYALAFLLKEVFEYLSTARFIMSNRFANRFFLYGNWGLIFFCYVALFLFVILTSRYINKQIQFNEPKNKKKEVIENE